MTTLTPDQYTWLTQGIHQNRVRQLKGQSHLEAWDVRRTLIRIFGFGGFDVETKSLELVREMEFPPGSITYKNRDGSERTNERTAWTVIYRAEVRLIIKTGGSVLAVFEDAASGDSQNQPVLGDAHDHAMKTALSQALKRCAVNMGDQFGLSLYNGGNVNPVVLRSLVVPEGTQQPVVAQPPEEAPVQPEPQLQVEGSAAEETAGAPPASEPSLRARDLFQLITEAASLGELKALWESTNEAGVNGEITARDAEQLKAHITKRKDEVPPEASLPPPEVTDDGPSEKQHKRMHALWRELGLGGVEHREERLTRTALVIGRDISTSKEMSPADADRLIEHLDRQAKDAKETVGASA